MNGVGHCFACVPKRFARAKAKKMRDKMERQSNREPLLRPKRDMLKSCRRRGLRKKRRRVRRPGMYRENEIHHGDCKALFANFSWTAVDEVEEKE